MGINPGSFKGCLLRRLHTPQYVRREGLEPSYRNFYGFARVRIWWDPFTRSPNVSKNSISYPRIKPIGLIFPPTFQPIGLIFPLLLFTFLPLFTFCEQGSFAEHLSRNLYPQLPHPQSFYFSHVFTFPIKPKNVKTLPSSRYNPITL